MTKIKSTILFLQILILPLIVQAQYGIQEAFPNLPSIADITELTFANDGTNRLFVTQQVGIINVFVNSPTVNTKKVFLNISNKVSTVNTGGLLGLAFHPNYLNNRYFYVHYEFDSAGNMPNQYIRISRFTASSTNPDSALKNSEQILFTISLPDWTHNGGKLAFGPDNFLYLAIGDGYSEHIPQDKSLLLGKMLRINVDSSANGKNYSIPTSNPFFGNTQGWKQEIYAYGLRNPWRFSFDIPTNRIWLGDVGFHRFEEINLIQIGKDYGWNGYLHSGMEGLHCFPDTNICDTAGRGYTRPVWEYFHTIFTEAYSITGGYVYRGALLPNLYGKYIYADFIQGRIWGLTYDGINPTTNVLMVDTTYLFSTFGIDKNNELYVCRYSSDSGRIYKLYNKNTITLNLKVSIQGFYNVSLNRLNIKDTLNVYLRSSNSPYSIVDSSKTVIDSLSYTGLGFFNNAPTGKYYIAIRHRNALETWSKSGGDSLKRGSVTNYDFTTDSSQAYGNNQIKKGNKYCLYSGDVNQDEIIDGTDNVIIENDSYLYLFGIRLPTDLNADYFVDGTDLTYGDNNSALLVEVIRP